ncbi:MAG: NAD(P)-dependent oxidoreductase [Phycisphaerae bacterium]
MNMVKVAVTATEFDKAAEVFRHAASFGMECLRAPAAEAELAAFVRAQGVRHAIVGVEKYAGTLYEALPAGAVLARFGVGHDGIDKDKATARGVICTNTPGVLDDSVAEMTIALILAAVRHVATVAAEVKQGRFAPTVGSELAGKTLAVIGCGPIGRKVARIAARGFGMLVVGCDVVDLDIERMKTEYGFVEIGKDFGAAVATADFVSLHIPSTSATRHFVNRDRLAMIPAGAWLINTARGAVLDEAALYDAISQGMLAGAALDVFEAEPYKPVAPEKDLRRLDNVLMTPHVGSSTREACNRMAERALKNIQLAEAGRFGEMDVLNPAVIRGRS